VSTLIFYLRIWTYQRFQVYRLLLAPREDPRCRPAINHAGYNDDDDNDGDDNDKNNRATGTISKSFRKYMSNIAGNHEIKELQKTAILGTAHTLRKVLM